LRADVGSRALGRARNRGGEMRRPRLVAGALAAACFVAAVAADDTPHAIAAPNDPLFAQQWPLANSERASVGNVGALEAWRYTRGAPEVLIAVLDDGVQLDHPDLAANIASAGRDFGTDPPRADASPRTPADRHGTAVAGVVAARGDNGVGMSGICPLCKILPIRIEGASTAGLAAAFRYAVEQGADVITNSWGRDEHARLAEDPALRAAIELAARSGRAGRGALVVFAVTNDVVDNCTNERADVVTLPEVFAVGASNHRDEVGGSGFGDCLDLVAPTKPADRSTVGVPATDRTGIDGHTAGDYYADFGGTSAAAPLVAGVAGLLLALEPDLTREALEAILVRTADKIDPDHAAYDATGFSRRAGFGRVNAARALRAVVERSDALSR
jgi:subtilisin family serine protease